MRHLRSKEPMACYRSVRSQRFSTQMNRHASACGTGAKTIGGTVTGSTSGEHFGTSGALRHFGDSQLWSEVGDLRSAMKNGTPLVVSFDPNSFLLMRGRGHPGFLSGTLWFYWREYELLSQSRTSGHSGLSRKPTLEMSTANNDDLGRARPSPFFTPRPTLRFIAHNHPTPLTPSRSSPPLPSVSPNPSHPLYPRHVASPPPPIPDQATRKFSFPPPPPADRSHSRCSHREWLFSSSLHIAR